MKEILKKRSFYSLLVVGLLAACSIFYAIAEFTMPTEAGIRNPPGRVLIVVNKNKLNDPLITKVAQILKKEGNYVKLGFGTSLKGMCANTFGAIVIINFIEDKSKDRSVEVFADESAQKKIVLLNLIGAYSAPDKIAFDLVERTKVVLLKH